MHPAWIVAFVAFLALVGAAGFRAAPGVLILPLEDEFGWSRAELSVAVSINLLLFGLTAPFAAALMERFGLRRITSIALVIVAAGSGLSVFATASWQLVLTWGVLIGLGTGSMALVFAATVANTWFVRRRGLVVGILTAGSATGQLAFLPVVAVLVEQQGWREASLLIAGGALVVVPLVLIFLRDHPSDLDVTPFGSPDADVVRPVRSTTNPAKRAIGALVSAAKVRTFWALVAGFAICGATTNGLIGTHFIPSAHDHGMPETTAAGLLAVVGVFDIIGTVASGWLTDRVNPRILLVAYYAFRGVGLLSLPSLLSAEVRPSIVIFVVIYGLDWVATVPPTVALCREVFGDDGPLVFGWVFASHQIGAAIAASVAGLVRTAPASTPSPGSERPGCAPSPPSSARRSPDGSRASPLVEPHPPVGRTRWLSSARRRSSRIETLARRFGYACSSVARHSTSEWRGLDRLDQRKGCSTSGVRERRVRR